MWPPAFAQQPVNIAHMAAFLCIIKHSTKGYYNTDYERELVSGELGSVFIVNLSVMQYPRDFTLTIVIFLFPVGSLERGKSQRESPKSLATS
jgi:hypothetical protein